MALSTNSVWEIRTAGNVNNGGGFVSSASGTDRSQQDAAFATLTVASVVHTTITQINVALGDFVVSAADIGNILQITGGTATAGFYQITIVDVPNNRWTLDRNVGTAGQTVVGAMGGALAALSKLGTVAVAGNIIWIKSGTYTITSATPNVAGGTYSSSIRVMIEGYNAARGDLGNKPLFQASGITNFTLIAATHPGSATYNVEVDGVGLASSRGINSEGIVYLCKADNCVNNGFRGIAGTFTIDCVATGCSAVAAFTGGNFANCIAHDNTFLGFGLITIGGIAMNCIADSNSGATSDGFLLNVTGIRVSNCVAYNNGRDGFRIVNDNNNMDNNIAESNTGFGFFINNRDAILMRNNAGFGNTGGETSLGTGKFVSNISFVTGASSFFTNPASQDFTLNATAGAGANARGAGFPGALVIGGTGFIDIGTLQHLDSGGGGGGEHSAVF